MRRRPSPSLRRTGTAALAALCALTFLVGVSVVDVAAQDDTTPSTTADTTVQTTSTLPTDNRELGNSLTRPNQGMDPQSPGDPGGWLQQSLFFLICGAIVVIALLVWRSSHRARSRRSDAGLDPVSVARARGEGVRQSTPDTPDA